MKTQLKSVTDFSDSTPLLGSTAQLNARAQDDGFLFFKNFLPQDLLLRLRREILEIVNHYGWIKKGTNLMEAIADPETVARTAAGNKSLYAIGVTPEAYRDIQLLELFHTIPHYPKLLALYETLWRTPVLPHPRHIARVLLPAPGFAATPPHQDYVYIQGTHRFWTCWFPLGDCPMELGGLSLLRGSHREKVLDVTRAAGAGGAEAILCDKDYTWVQDNYGCGDMVTFPSHTVHKALPNQRGTNIRLSCDLRYQPADDVIDESSLQPHLGIATWDEIYRRWNNEKLKYYWKNKNLKLSPWDASLLNAKERIC